MPNQPRDAQAEDLDSLAHIWWSGWRDAHLDLVPEALAKLRTQDSFRDRLGAALPRVRTLGPVGAPLGFHLIKDDELYQFYVAVQARGTGAAATLMADAEANLLALGIETPWLACAIGNARAARFYDVWRYEKRLA
jgi:GNAT superfamily N-acetyltransferase